MNNELAAKVDYKCICRTIVHLYDVPKSTNTNMATIRYFEIISNEFDKCRICSY